MLSRSEPQEEIEIATNKITTMFLYFGKSEPQCSYKHGSYKKKRVYLKSWSAHSENLLTSMLCDSDPTQRAFAVLKIHSLRNGQDQGDASVRKFLPPPLNLEATNLSELIDWDSVTVYESILTCHLSNREIQDLIMRP